MFQSRDYSTVGCEFCEITERADLVISARVRPKTPASPEANLKSHN